MYEDQKQEPSGILLKVPEPTCTIKPEDCLPPGKTEGSVLRPFIGVDICYQKMTACLLNSASYLPSSCAYRHVLCPYAVAAVFL